MKKELYFETIFAKPKIEEQIEGLNKKYIISGPFTMADKPNGNNRIYPKKVLNESIGKFRDKVNKKQIKMGMDHDYCGSGALSMTAALLLEVTDVQDDGFAYYKAQIMDTSKGKDLKAIVDSGAMVGVSTVGRGDYLLDQEYPPHAGKFTVMKEGFKLQKVDFVDDPSVEATEDMMQLENKDYGICYVSESKFKKEKDMSKTLDELRKEFPESFVDFDKSSKLNQENLEKAIAKLTEHENKIKVLNTLAESIKAVEPSLFTQTIVLESEITKQKDAEIAKLNEQANSLQVQINKMVEEKKAFEAKTLVAEKEKAIATIQIKDPEYFTKYPELVKQFDNCITPDEIAKVYENNKKTINYVIESSKVSLVPPKTISEEPKKDELSKEQLADFNSRNVQRIGSGIKPMSIEQYKKDFCK